MASRTPGEPLEWQKSTLLKGDVADAVAALKREGRDDPHVFGGAELVLTLLSKARSTSSG